MLLLLATLAPTTLPAQVPILPPVYSGKEIRATVVDHETERPLEGAVVVALWRLRGQSGSGPSFHVGEAATDADGRFAMPPWGPKLRPPLSHADTQTPYLVVFKSGYVPVRLINVKRSDFARLRAMKAPASKISRDAGVLAYPEANPYDLVQDSLWNGMAIRLEPFRGTPEEWLEKLSSFESSIGFGDTKSAPRFFEALSLEREYFTSHPLGADKRIQGYFVSVFASIDIRVRMTKEP